LRSGKLTDRSRVDQLPQSPNFSFCKAEEVLRALANDILGRGDMLSRRALISEAALNISAAQCGAAAEFKGEVGN
jgi:hypothetical protein